MSKLGTAVLALGMMHVHAATYYVATDGSDAYSANQAQDTATPWKTVNYAAAQLDAGDVLRIRGGVYREQVTVGVSGDSLAPVVIENYPGERPVIDGGALLTGWTRCTADDSGLTVGGTVNPHYSNIWRADISRTVLKNVNKAWVFERGRFLSPACDPDQEDADILNLDTFVPVRDEAGNVGQNAYLVDTERFTQATTDYWKDAFIKIFMNNANGNTYTTFIDAYDPAAHKVIFRLKPSDNLHASDVYMVFNHPHALDRAGEFCYTTVPVDGHYTVYVWPETEADLDSAMSLAYRTCGFYLSSRQWVTIRGLEIRNGFQYGVYANGGSGISVERCRIHSINGKGVFASGCDRMRVEDCHASAVKGEDGNGFGINLTNGNANRIIRDTVWQSEHSAIYYSNATGGIISDCLVEHWDGGVHNNGITVYTNCDDILVARNRAVYLRLNTVSDICVYNNIFTGPDGAISAWAGVSGTVHILNNMLTGTAWSVSLWGSMGTQVVYNNVIRDRIQYPGTNDYNIYLTSAAFEDKAHDILADGVSGRPGLDDIIENYAGGDFHLTEGSVAVDAGRDIMGLLPVSAFPDFDFGVDMDGNVRTVGGGIDIGPYEYGSYTEIMYRELQTASGTVRLPNPLHKAAIPALRKAGFNIRIFSADGQEVAADTITAPGSYLVGFDGTIRQVTILP